MAVKMAKVKRNSSKAGKKAIAHIRAQRGLDRHQFLKENGDMKQWIPAHIVYIDRKKLNSRLSCRKFKF